VRFLAPVNPIHEEEEMITITLEAPLSLTGQGPLRFRIPARSALLAGSRNGFIEPEEADRIVTALGSAGFSFLVGCATGVDACFRLTLAEHPDLAETTFVACAFENRLRASESRGLFASVVVPQGLSPAAALRRRTLWMIKRVSLLVLFPDNPLSGRWGRGSTLAFRAATEQLKPVFVVSRKRPPAALHYRVVASRLFETADGWWAVPHPVAAGTCDEEV
jgi:hypothetical protein